MVSVLTGLGKSLDTVLKSVSWLGALAGTGAVFFMALLVATEVIARGVFNKPFLDIVLTGRLAMIVIIFLGAAWVFRQDRHVAVRFILDRLPVRVRTWVEVVSLTAALGAIGLVVSETWEFAYAGFRLNEKILGGYTVRAFPFQVLITIGFGLLGMEVMSRIIRKLKKVLTEEPGEVALVEEAGARVKDEAWKSL